MAMDDVYQLVMTMQGPGGYYQNSYHFSLITATEPAQANFQTLANDVRDIHRSNQADTLFFRTWKARQVRGGNVVWPTSGDCNPTGGKLFEGNYTSPTNGSQTGETLPPQCAMVVTLKTLEAGRRHRGRVYIPGFIETAQANGSWTSTFLTNIETGWATFMAKYAPGTAGNFFQLCIWSFRTASGCEQDRATGKHVRIDPPHPELAETPVFSHLVRPIVYTQRRRTSGVGR